MTEEQQAAADKEAIRADKWAKKMAERAAVKAEADAARATLSLTGPSVMHTRILGDGTKHYSNGGGTRSFYDQEPNPYSNMPNAKAPGSSADLWNINNGRDRDVNYGERDKTTVGHGMDSPLSAGTGIYAGDTSGMFNAINQDNFQQFEYKQGMDLAKTAKEQAAFAKGITNLQGEQKAAWNTAVQDWANDNPSLDGAQEIIQGARNGMFDIPEEKAAVAVEEEATLLEGQVAAPNAPTYESVRDEYDYLATLDPASEESRDGAYKLGTRENIDAYVASMGKVEDTNPETFFNVVHSMFATNPTEFKKWQRENPEMAVRFHAMAASEDIFQPGNDQYVDWDATTDGDNPVRLWGEEAGTWNKEKHQQYADVIADQLAQAAWGDERKRNGQVYASNFSGDISKDVNNAQSGGDFWKIGTPQKVTDGIGNFIQDNPAQVALIAATIALAPYATQAIAGSLAGTIPAAAIPAVSGGIYAAGSQLVGQVVTGQDLDLAGALKTGAISAATFGIVQGGSDYLQKAIGVSAEVADKVVSIGLETAANGGDFMAAVTDELVATGMEFAGDALDGLTGAIGDAVADVPADAPWGGLEEIEVDADYIGRPVKPELTGDAVVDAQNELSFANDSYDYYEKNPNAINPNVDSIGRPITEDMKDGLFTDKNGNEFGYGSGVTSDNIEESASWESGDHAFQDYEGPIRSDGSGPVDVTHPYWETTAAQPDIEVPQTDAESGGGGGGSSANGGGGGAPATESSPELSDKPVDVQENALSNAPPVGDRGDTNYYTVDAEGNYVDPNTVEYGSTEYTSPDGTKAGSAIDVQLMEAAHAETDPTIKADLEASWEQYTGKDYPAGDPAWDDYYTKTEIPATDQSGWSQVSYADADAHVGDVGLGNNPTLPTADLLSDLINPDYNPDDVLGTGQIFKDTTEATPVGKGDGSGYANVDNWDEAAWQNMVDTVLAAEGTGEGGDGSGGMLGDGPTNGSGVADGIWGGVGIDSSETVNLGSGGGSGAGTGTGTGEGTGSGSGGGNGSGSGSGTGGGAGLGSGSALVGNGSAAAKDGNLFDYTQLSPAAYAILAPMIDHMDIINNA